MVRRLLPVMIAMAALWAAWHLDLDGTHSARADGRRRTSPDLFYNYYVPPAGCGGGGRALPVSPAHAAAGRTYVRDLSTTDAARVSLPASSHLPSLQLRRRLDEDLRQLDE